MKIGKIVLFAAGAVGTYYLLNKLWGRGASAAYDPAVQSQSIRFPGVAMPGITPIPMGSPRTPFRSTQEAAMYVIQQPNSPYRDISGPNKLKLVSIYASRYRSQDPDPQAIANDPNFQALAQTYM